jgi:hypothetical protein
LSFLFVHNNSFNPTPQENAFHHRIVSSAGVLRAADAGRASSFQGRRIMRAASFVVSPIPHLSCFVEYRKAGH